MGPIGCPETSVKNYHYALCNNPEESSSRHGDYCVVFSHMEPYVYVHNVQNRSFWLTEKTPSL